MGRKHGIKVGHERSACLNGIRLLEGTDGE
jgi:hypothetical protein